MKSDAIYHTLKAHGFGSFGVKCQHCGHMAKVELAKYPEAIKAVEKAVEAMIEESREANK